MPHAPLTLALLATTLLAQAAQAAQSAHAQTALSHDQWLQKAASLRAAWAAHPDSHPATPTEPSLTAGQILTPSIDVTKAPPLPIITLSLNSGSVGIGAIQVQLVSPSGLHGVNAYYGLPSYPLPPYKRTIPVQIASPFAGGNLGIYSERGAWNITGVTLITADGSFVFYSGSQLAALFPSLTVNVTNPNTPDITRPTIYHGKILTPTVSLSSPSPFFVATTDAADNNSGVTGVYLGYANGTYSSTAATTLLAPLHRGAVTLSGELPPSAPLGTYTITSFTVCDQAQNCLTDQNEADVQAKFGATTFTVTN